ncbi:MAG: FAD-dependent oxidoreductase [Nocardioides sp.]
MWLAGVRSQRRLRRCLADPRLSQRAGAVAGGAGHPGPAGAENLDAIEDTVRRHRIDCHFERTGELDVATAPHQLDSLAEAVDDMRAGGHDVELWDQERTRAAVDSPTYLGALWDPHGVALVEPARLAWGLRQACLESGVRIFEQSTVRSLRDDGRELELATAAGRLRARRVALATNGFPPLLRRLRLMTVPVYDYVLATEPLSDAQLASVGWAGRQGVGDSANLFHYYRLTRDNRILWGGYDAVYHYGSRIDPALEQAGRTHALLAQQFFDTFPSWRGWASRTAGPVSSTPAPASRRSTGRRQPTASPTRSASRGWASRPPGSPVTCCWTCWVVRRPSAPACGWCVGSRCRSRPSRPGRGDQPHPVVPGARRRPRGRRNLWLRGLDRLGLGFDS